MQKYSPLLALHLFVFGLRSIFVDSVDDLSLERLFELWSLRRIFVSSSTLVRSVSICLCSCIILSFSSICCMIVPASSLGTFLLSNSFSNECLSIYSTQQKRHPMTTSRCTYRKKRSAFDSPIPKRTQFLSLHTYRHQNLNLLAFTPVTDICTLRRLTLDSIGDAIEAKAAPLHRGRGAP